MPGTEGDRQTSLQSQADIYKLPPRLHLTVQRYEGETCEGHFHGQGVAFYKGGHTYKGVFSKGLMNGAGVFTLAGGLTYEGEFVRNTLMGQGTYTWPNGSTYKGDVYNGIRHGSGTYKCARSSVFYSGQWHLGKRHGKGTVYYNDDKTSWYKGDWVRNNREGWGVRCYPSGNIYTGEWKNNQRHGEGTMKWVKLGQQYDGTWHDGVQHGQGTHVWILRRVDETHYFRSNQYAGDFVQGQRHGRGVFYYADGAMYEGEWKNNKKHGQGKFTFTDGRVYDGEFSHDWMINSSGNRTPIPLGAFLLSQRDSSALGPDMALDIECLLDKILERKRGAEREQVEFAVLRQNIELRSIYSFYSRLGRAHSPDNTFMLFRLQLWRLLKDCKIHHHGITLTEIARFISEDADSVEIHSLFTAMLLREFLSCLVMVAYHIYNEDMLSQKYLLAACFSKLMIDDILPNAKNVKGFLFSQPGVAVLAMKYMKRCWEVFQAFCRVSTANRNDQTMTCRHLLWMFKDLCLLDHKLTTRRCLGIISAESYDPNNFSSSAELKITFLEFFEVLLGCAEIKCEQASEALKEDHSLSGSDTEAHEELPEVEASEEMTQTKSPSQSMGNIQDVGGQHNVKTEVNEIQSAEHKDRAEIVRRPAEMENEDHKVEHRMQTVDHFFNHIFFPAFDHYQLLTGNK